MKKREKKSEGIQQQQIEKKKRNRGRREGLLATVSIRVNRIDDAQRNDCRQDIPFPSPFAFPFHFITLYSLSCFLLCTFTLFFFFSQTLSLSLSRCVCVCRYLSRFAPSCVHVRVHERRRTSEKTCESQCNQRWTGSAVQRRRRVVNEMDFGGCCWRLCSQGGKTSVEHERASERASVGQAKWRLLERKLAGTVHTHTHTHTHSFASRDGWLNAFSIKALSIHRSKERAAVVAAEAERMGRKCGDGK